MIVPKRSDYFEGDRWLGKRWQCSICAGWRSGKEEPVVSSDVEGKSERETIVDFFMFCAACMAPDPDPTDPDDGEPVSEEA